MSTFKDRLIIEKNELDEKRIKLRLYLNSDEVKQITPLQISLLKIQEQAMATYAQCLYQRIAWLEALLNKEITNEDIKKFLS